VSVALLHYGPPSFLFTSNSISDLQAIHCGSFEGNHVCSPDNVAANAGVFLAGLCLMAGALLDWAAFTREGLSRLDGYLLLIAGVAACSNAFTPEDVTPIGDDVTALAIFLAANVALILIGWSGRPVHGIPHFLTYPRVLGEFGLAAFLVWALGLSGPLGTGIEWLVVAPVMVWMVITGARKLTWHGPSSTAGPDGRVTS
jgi:hypothetical membrane protein